MEKISVLDKYTKIHFIGIGGISMSALALYAKSRGKTVSGSDSKLSDKTEELVKSGITVEIHDEKNVSGKDLIVYNSAIEKDNPELKKAVLLKIPLLKRSEFLGEILKDYKKSVGISGSHGKTTATAMLTHVFIKAGLNPTSFIGGDDKTYSNFRLGEGDFVITEACEFKRNFLDLSPKTVVILNVDNDHLDSYKTIENEIEAFKNFAFNKITFINADDENAVKVKNGTTFTFGIINKAEFTAKNVKKEKNGYSFTAYAFNRKLGRINLKIAGIHNVYNALSVIAVAYYYKIDFYSIKSGLEEFDGVKRRLEKIGEIYGKSVFSDYAHHPKEISALMDSIDLKSTLFIFQPHTYSRTENLMQDFIKVLKRASVLIIYKTYPAREEYKKEGSAKELYFRLNDCMKRLFYAEREDELKTLVKKNLKGVKSIYFVGAGDIYEIGKRIIKD